MQEPSGHPGGDKKEHIPGGKQVVDYNEIPKLRKTGKRITVDDLLKSGNFYQFNKTILFMYHYLRSLILRPPDSKLK